LSFVQCYPPNIFLAIGALEGGYFKVRTFEFMAPLIENMEEDFRRQFFEKRKEHLPSN
jgi:hypothetical protein